MSTFQLHPRLEADCHQLGQIGTYRILLHRNAVLHWLIVVPETDAVDLLDLPAPEREAALEICARLSRYLKAEHAYPKVNFGAIGNLVPQLHLHVIGRRPGDTCWPAPAWGNLKELRDYTAPELAALHAALTPA